MKNKPAIPYETNAERQTVEGWCCKTCHRFWGNDEHMAKWCCCTDLPCRRCESKRTEKHYTICKDCRDAQRVERFEKLLSKPYDGSAVVTYDSDNFFYDEESLLDWIVDNELTADDLRLVFAECKKPTWGRSVSELLVDDLAEDDEWDTSEIDKQIAEWVDANAPSVYWPTSVAVARESIVELLAKASEQL